MAQTPTTPAMVTSKATVILSLLLLGASIGTSSGSWRQYRSSRGFVVMYPGSWFHFGSSSDRLDIRSARGGAEGVIIKQGQASIGVFEPPDSAGPELDKIVHYYMRDEPVMSRREILRRSRRHGCEQLTEAIFKEPIIPAEGALAKVPVTVNTLLLCRIGDRVIATLQRNFEGDGRQDYYRQVAVRMAGGIELVSK